jgi:hypothetical protein
MKKESRPDTLTNAPLQYWPSNELGVVFLFANIFRKKQFRIEEIKPKFPDCIAYKRTGDGEKRVRIEFEFHSSNFKTHGHDPRKCDCIVCWHHDWPECPKRIEVIELKREFGAAPKVWIQPAIKSQCHYFDEYDEFGWSLSKRASKGDLLLMYRCSPEKSINNLFVVVGEKSRGKASWREGDCYYAKIKRLCDLKSPIFLDDMRNHKILRTSSFIRSNMQGNKLVSEYWPYLYEMIVSRNPDVKKNLRDFAPENL